MDDTWWKKATELDDDQKRIISDLDIRRNHLVVGPPGSGKTNILVLRATYLHLQGFHSLAIVTFGRTLKEFLATGVGHYDFASDKIQTYQRWGVGVLRHNGQKIERDADFDTNKEMLGGKLSELLSTGGGDLKYDVIMLDEAQDYTAEEIDIFLGFGRNVFAVGDFNQRIYSQKGGLERLREVCDCAPPLKYHYRNGRKICRVADGLRDLVDSKAGLEATSLYDEAANPSVVEVVPAGSIEEQAKNAINQLKTQLLAYPDERIGVACPKKEDVRKVWATIEGSELAERAQLQLYEEGYAPLDPEKPICVTTLHGTKGMEFRALHIAGTERIKRFGEHQRNLIYTGVTRAKTSLTIHHAESLPGYLENALEGIAPPKAPPKIEDLFKA